MSIDVDFPGRRRAKEVQQTIQNGGPIHILGDKISGFRRDYLPYGGDFVEGRPGVRGLQQAQITPIEREIVEEMQDEQLKQRLTAYFSRFTVKLS